jgi:hypothetical protein
LVGIYIYEVTTSGVIHCYHQSYLGFDGNWLYTIFARIILEAAGDGDRLFDVQMVISDLAGTGINRLG